MSRFVRAILSTAVIRSAICARVNPSGKTIRSGRLSTVVVASFSLPPMALVASHTPIPAAASSSASAPEPPCCELPPRRARTACPYRRPRDHCR